MLRFKSIKQFIRFRRNLLREYYDNYYFENSERDDLSWRMYNSYFHKKQRMVSVITARQLPHRGGLRSNSFWLHAEHTMCPHETNTVSRSLAQQIGQSLTGLGFTLPQKSSRDARSLSLLYKSSELNFLILVRCPSNKKHRSFRLVTSSAYPLIFFKAPESWRQST